MLYVAMKEVNESTARQAFFFFSRKEMQKVLTSNIEND